MNAITNPAQKGLEITFDSGQLVFMFNMLADILEYEVIVENRKGSIGKKIIHPDTAKTKDDRIIFHLTDLELRVTAKANLCESIYPGEYKLIVLAKKSRERIDSSLGFSLSEDQAAKLRLAFGEGQGHAVTKPDASQVPPTSELPVDGSKEIVKQHGQNGSTHGTEKPVETNGDTSPELVAPNAPVNAVDMATVLAHVKQIVTGILEPHVNEVKRLEQALAASLENCATASQATAAESKRLSAELVEKLVEKNQQADAAIENIGTQVTQAIEALSRKLTAEMSAQDAERKKGIETLTDWLNSEIRVLILAGENYKVTTSNCSALETKLKGLAEQFEQKFEHIVQLEADLSQKIQQTAQTAEILATQPVKVTQTKMRPNEKTITQSLVEGFCWVWNH